MAEVVPDHKEPRGMGAARRDDHPENIVASCNPCNLDKGSRRDFQQAPTEPTRYEEIADEDGNTDEVSQ